MSGRKSLVIAISDHADAHLPFVSRHLDNPLLIMDPVDIIQGRELSYRLKGQRMAVTYEGRNLGGASGAWYRKPHLVTHNLVPVREHHQGYCQDGIRSHLSLLYTSLAAAVWISDVHAIRRASDKSLQLTLARQIGFRVPDTVITSDAHVARRFIASHEPYIVKPLSRFAPEDPPGRSRLYFATKHHRDANLDLHGLHLAPTIFQEAIDTAADLRVTVVGERAFPAIITVDGLGQDLPTVRDWRVGHFKGKMRIEPYELPEDMERKCIAHVKKLGLNFGAIDLVLDRKNEI